MNIQVIKYLPTSEWRQLWHKSSLHQIGESVLQVAMTTFTFLRGGWGLFFHSFENLKWKVHDSSAYTPAWTAVIRYTIQLLCWRNTVKQMSRKCLHFLDLAYCLSRTLLIVILLIIKQPWHYIFHNENVDFRGMPRSRYVKPVKTMKTSSKVWIITTIILFTFSCIVSMITASKCS